MPKFRQLINESQDLKPGSLASEQWLHQYVTCLTSAQGTGSRCTVTSGKGHSVLGAGWAGHTLRILVEEKSQCSGLVFPAGIRSTQKPL